MDQSSKCANKWKGKCTSKKVKKNCPKMCGLCGGGGGGGGLSFTASDVPCRVIDPHENGAVSPHEWRSFNGHDVTVAECTQLCTDNIDANRDSRIETAA